jgi:putative ABC transport system permease protein
VPFVLFLRVLCGEFSWFCKILIPKVVKKFYKPNLIIIIILTKPTTYKNGIKIGPLKQNNPAMLSSDFKAALRSILRNRIPSAISVLGLGIGLGCIIILIALISHEKSFDNYIPDYKNVYRITLGNVGQAPYPLPEVMAGEFPEVKDYFRYYKAISLPVRTSRNEIIRENGFGFADSTVFRILGLKFLSGTWASSRSEVAISESAAMKYFGNLSPVGAALPVKFSDGFTPLTVTGVFEDLPSNSTLYPSLIADIRLSERMFSHFQKTLGEYGSTISIAPDWTRNDFLVYIVLAANADPSAVSEKMEKFKEFITLEQKKENKFKLQPVRDIYLDSEGLSGNQFLRQGNPGELVYFEIIAVLILTISLANYILLTRAGVAEKVMNLGTRKAFGASRGKIRRLILLESNLVVFISLVPAVFIIDYGIKFVNTTLNKTLSPDVFLNPFLLITLVVVVIFTGTVSGWLLGLYYSKIPALNLISGNTRTKGRNGKWNYSFLVLHFTIYMVFAAGLMAVSKQIEFSKSGFTGINPENVLVAELTSESLMKSFSTIKNEMDRVPGVVATAGGSFIPPFGNFLPINLAVQGGDRIRFDGLIMGEGMAELLGMEVIDGTSFGAYKEGVPEVLINESAAKEQVVRAGEKLLVFNVKGIVKDFHAHSMHTAIQPLVILQQNPAMMRLIAIKTDGSNDAVIRERLRMLFNQIAPDEIFEAEFLTGRIEDFYVRERNQARLIGAFAVLAAILSIMGLFGISMMSITKRRKEIGLRKVNGAATREVLLMVNADFLKWVFISMIIAVPAAIWLLNKWLERFAYKTELDWWIFALAGLSAIVIAVLTVSWQSIKASTSNPVEAIRYE